MKVSPATPFQLIYTLFEHEYLGYMFESFVIQLDNEGRLTLSHQNISAHNSKEFDSGIDEVDYELIKIMDSMQQDAVANFFNKKKIKPNDFFLKAFNGDIKNEPLQKEILRYMEVRRAKILPLLKSKMLFEMGEDGEPTWKKIEILQNSATVLFHFRRNEENTHYFSTIKYNDEKIDFRYKGAFILCNSPAYIVLESKLYHFSKNVDANKLKPFLNKKFIAIPKKIEDSYYRKFVAPLVGAFDVYAKGFEIKTENYEVKPKICFSKLATHFTPTLFDEKPNGSANEDGGKILFELSFNYGNYNYKADDIKDVSVYVEKIADDYTFHRVRRMLDKEKEVIKFLKDTDLVLKHSRVTLATSDAFRWIRNTQNLLESAGITLQQSGSNGKKYFMGTSKIDVQVKENIDWFDINAIIRFGEFEISFKVIRKYILKGTNEIVLPNGEVAVIPEEWFLQYAELFAFSEEKKDGLSLQKHHIALISDLSNNKMANVKLSDKLAQFESFEKIDRYDIPKFFKGELREYQRAGYDWMNFLQEYDFGGCLADDMGLGKTVQTLAMLQAVKEKGHEGVSLLAMPTSLVYNWEKEAEKFTPQLKILNYTGVKRNKEVTRFSSYDLVITSYGIIRQDIETLSQFHFLYAILDESQVIKNPDANIAKAVQNLKSTYKLILTGTPIENSTMDLWSQMNFINPGLLGSKAFFKKQFQIPIEKHNNEERTKKLYTIINPFLLRRTKDQVATDLPDKIETVRYCSMTNEQEKAYDEVKSAYRNSIMTEIEAGTIGKSSFMILQGLTKLRQIANHPKMADETYRGDSGKLKEISYMLEDAIQNGHKILVFSQFVKHLKIISDYLNEQEIEFCYLDGQTKDRKGQVEKFQNNEKIKVFLISLKAGGLGLNLTEADYVFILDPWWNPASEAQAVDRAHRIGQKNQVFTYRFITKNSVEEKIMKLQSRKKKLASDLITTEESFMKSLSKEDMVSLLD